MRIVTTLVLAGSAAASLELLKAGQTGSWSATGNDSFQLGKAAHNRHAYRKTWIGKSTNGGLCPAPGSSHLEVGVTMLDSGFNKGNYAAISMRADSKTGNLGYQCRASTEHGDNGISLLRAGKALSGACPRIDQNNGVYNRYTTGFNTAVKGPYKYLELCQIQERVKQASLFSNGKTYTMRMSLVENRDLNTITVSCSIDGVTKLYFTDPCPLESGEFAFDAKYQTKFQVTDYTKMTCDRVPQQAVAAPSLNDGLSLIGMGRTGKYWMSKDLAKSNAVVHRYSGGCNNGAYPYGASSHPGGSGFNREGGGRSNSALNVAALSSGKCVKDGFIEADVTFSGDFLGLANGYGKVGTDKTVDQNQRQGVAGIAMRVDKTDSGTATKNNAYNSFGYMCQISARTGQVAVYRGRNGAHHNYNGIGSAYLTGRYRCKNCVCNSFTGCKQFSPMHPGAKNTLRLQVNTDAGGHPVVECSLNGTTVVSVADKRSGRHNWFPTSAKSPGPSSATNSCGDFGLVTTDSDIVSYQITDYTGYVPKKMCCKAMTKDCLACAAGMSVKEFCAKNVGKFGCPKPTPICCQAMTKECLACAQGVTVQAYCAKNAGKFGCPTTICPHVTCKLHWSTKADTGNYEKEHFVRVSHDPKADHTTFKHTCTHDRSTGKCTCKC